VVLGQARTPRLWEAVLFKNRALLVAGLSIALGLCFRPVAETIVVAPAHSQTLSGGESGLIEEAGRREDKLSKEGFDFVHYVSPDARSSIELFLLRSNVDYLNFAMVPDRAGLVWR
jgi:hypothetical protein